jgi:uncharacterized protein YdaU (DUF1376 family)
MPMYWGDYLRDTSRLTALEHGCYLLLIASYWNEGGLPNDPAALRRITRCPNNQWAKVWGNLQPYFSVQRNKFGSLELKHKRIDAELEKASTIALKRQVYGAKGGFSNRGKTNQERNFAKHLLKQTVDQSQSHSNLTSFSVAARSARKRPTEEER